eukprot:gene39594-53532_t
MTAASNSNGTPQASARMASSAPCSAIRALLAVTTGFPAFRAASTAALAGPSEPAKAAVEAAPESAASEPAFENSDLDAALFYQLLVGEMEAEAGRQDTAYKVILDAARRSRDPGLFQRAIELAVKARSAERALEAVRAWRTEIPESTEALRTEVQLLVALDRPGEIAGPLRQLIEGVPVADRSAVIASVPRFFAEMADKKQALAAGEQALKPYVEQPEHRVAA